MRPWLVRVASESKDVAKRILETDLEQLTMILTTLVAAVVYGWIEGAIIVAGCIGRICDWAGPQGWWLFGHFSTYSVAMFILFSCITGGFGLVKGRSMFAKGKRYFLFTFAGNMPFCAMIEDFTFFFNTSIPSYRLTRDAWTNWGLPGFQLLDPWREGIKLWIPGWYIIVGIFWLAMMWIAHSCTVYDNLVKDEISKQIVPKQLEIPEHVEPKVELQPRPPEKVEAPAEVAKPVPPSPVQPTHRPEAEKAQEKTKPVRSIEAEEALKKLRARVLKGTES